MSYAIVDAGGKQVWIESGKFYDFNYIPSRPGDVLTLNRVLLVSNDNGIKIGNPCLELNKVKIKVLKHFKGRKIIVFKMKPKKNIRLKQGYRSRLTRVLIQDIV